MSVPKLTSCRQVAWSVPVVRLHISLVSTSPAFCRVVAGMPTSKPGRVVEVKRLRTSDGWYVTNYQVVSFGNHNATLSSLVWCRLSSCQGIWQVDPRRW